GLGRGVVLRRQEDLGGLLGDLSGDRIDPAVEEAGRVGAGRSGRDTLRDRGPQGLEPVEALRGRGRRVGADAGACRRLRVEDAPRAPVAGRSVRLDLEQQRVAIAIDRDLAQDEDVAARLALAPQATTRPGVEMDLAGGEGRGQRFSVEVGDHQDAPIGDVLDDPRDEAVARPEPDRRRVERQVHAAGSRATRTGRPAAAMAAFTSPIAWMRRWKIDAASTASAPPRSIAATKSAGPAAPPEAITGTSTRSVIARSSSMSTPDCVPSRSIEVTSSSPAPSATASTAQAMASRPVASRP